MTTNTVSRRVAWLRVVTLAIAAFIFNENNRVRYRCMKVNFVIHIT